MSMATSPKACPSQLVVLNKAFKLAEQWVNNMSSSLEDEPAEVKLEARPSRLGLGAKVSRQSKIGPSNDPIERKLYAKLDVGKRNSGNGGIKESAPSARNGSDNSEDSDEDLESRTKSFSKKRVVPSTSSLQINKKRK